jgi:O-antigen ligase
MTRGVPQSIPGEPRPRVYPGVRAISAPSTAALSQGAWSTPRPIPPMVRRMLLFFVAAMPFESFTFPLLPESLSPPKITGLLFFGFCLWYPKACFPRPAPAVLWFSGYLAVFLVLGMFVAPEVRGVPSQFLIMAQNVLLFWVGSSLLRDIRLTRQCIFAFGVATAGLAIGAVFHLPGFGSERMERAGRAGERMAAGDLGPNALGAMMAVAAVMLIGLLLDNTARTRARAWLLACSTAPLLLVLVATGSKGGLLSFVLGASLFLIPLAPSRRRFAAFVLGGFALIALGVMVARNPVAVRRLTDTVETGAVAKRNVIYPRAFEMFLERPVLGWGPIGFIYELGSRMGESVRDPHNTLLWLLLETGIVGTFFFLAGFRLCVRAAWRSRAGPEGVLPLALLVATTVKNFTGTGLGGKTLWLILAIALASPVASAKWKRAVSSSSRRAPASR